MRIATYNIEWFSALFDAESMLQLDGERSRRRDVTRRQQADAIATVLRAIDPDLLMIIEAPNTGRKQSTLTALESFAKHYRLRQNHAVMGFANGTEQEIAALYDPKVCMPVHDPLGAPHDGRADPAPRFDTAFHLDVDVDGQPDLHRFSKPPFELAVAVGDKHLRIIGVHAKSKAPHGARSEDEARQISIANRRKQLAQCVWLRNRVDGHLDAGEPLIVLGDFNDGPGLDAYEKLFGRSSIEVVLGPEAPAHRRLTDPHAFVRLDPRQGWSFATARFFNPGFKRYVNALLDYIMISSDLVEHAQPVWRIWHPFDDPQCFKDSALQTALLTASDHFPVTLDLTLGKNPR